MTITEAKHPDNNLLTCLSGSQAYGLATPTSDIDRKGIFVMPRDLFFGLEYLSQVENESHDEAFFEVGRFVELLLKSNPTVLELLFTKGEAIEHIHPLMASLDPDRFLAKSCFQPFVGYAQTQIRKAKGLKKKVFNPQPKERKSLMDFCHVVKGQGSVLLVDWLREQGWEADRLGLVRMDRMKNYYAVFHDSGVDLGYQGVVRSGESNAPALSSVSKGEKPVGWLYCNQEAYTVHCKEHKEYWDWVEKRNDSRYQGTLEHGQGYDAQNIMHTFRLLFMAREIFRDGTIRVHRPNREELLEIKSGRFPLPNLLDRIERLIAEIGKDMEGSDLPNEPDRKHGKEWLVKVRETWYSS
ncbi:MAG TPA: nucleotidyltransferase [Cytophagales bacterium]|nr:nucleotidyltransferase [Cytophagales bacterium]HAA22636.1 nucleotidyltransferase [Cytophagales bacterium]HAP61115.1 nucleotidyltransferase [Cytophagales bacterium]